MDMTRHDMDSLTLSDEALLRECEVDTYRSHGPGGQKRNKTDSAVRLRHRPSGLVAIGVESRSQHENKARALSRLRHLLALHQRRITELDGYAPSSTLRQYLQPATAPARSSRRTMNSFDDANSDDHRGAGSGDVADDAVGADGGGAVESGGRGGGALLRIRPSNPDYCLVLREVLDVLVARQFRTDRAAATLGMSSSQLARFLRLDDHAWAWVNQQRASAGLKPLR